MTSQRLQAGREAKSRVRHGGLERESALVAGDRLLIAAHGLQRRGEIGVRFGGVRRYRRRPVEQSRGFGVKALAKPQDAKMQQCLDMLGLRRERRLIGANRILEPPCRCNVSAS